MKPLPPEIEQRKTDEGDFLVCKRCHASVKDLSKNRGRFLRRHPDKCKPRPNSDAEQAKN